MPRLIILGTANAIPNEKQDNTHMALVNNNGFFLIDTANNPYIRLQQAGLDILDLTDLFLTHFHPDHVSGVPSLLMHSWLLGRKQPLRIYGLAHTIDRIEKLMQFYDWDSWPNLFPVKFHRLPEGEEVLAMENDGTRILSSTSKHHVPVIGLRIELKSAGKSLTYSSDTEPSEAIIRLADGVDILIHEATGESPGHSSAAQAGEVAKRAGAGHLYLIHYHYGDDETAQSELVEEAMKTFQGPVTLAKDLMTLEF